MAPEHLRVAAIIVALLSIGFFVVALARWPASGGERESDLRSRHGWSGGLLLFSISIGLVATLLAVAGAAGWNRDRTLWVGFGAFLCFMTVLRPWWFWENYRARWLRKLIGDGATILVYLVVATIMVWVGLNTDWTFGRQ